MINILNPTISMSIPEFLQVSRGELTVKDLKNKRKFEREGITLENMDEYLNYEYKKALRKKSMLALEAFISTTLLVCEKALAVVDPKSIDPKVKEAMAKVDNGGWVIMFVFRKISFWVCLILCIMEILKCVTQGDIKSVGKIVVRYIIIYGVSYFLPAIFDFIRLLFE